jgi:hypothetical protein
MPAPVATCPLHKLDFIRRADRDGEERHTCPAPECSFEFLRPLSSLLTDHCSLITSSHDPHGTPDPLHPGEDPAAFHDPAI